MAKDEAIVKADFVDLQTVWVNLLQNAIQHSPEGSTVSIEVEISEHGTAVVVVKDSGTGIPPEQLPHVFERFRRGDPSRSRATGGFGLGLSICKAIVEAYGGDIRIASPNGAGARVSVSLPAIRSLNAKGESAMDRDLLTSSVESSDG
jgi:signal transduction histidine kinase